MNKQGNKTPLRTKTPNSPKADPRGSKGEEIKHQIVALHEMIKETQ